MIKKKFIINFVLRDYDVLWVAIGSPDDINNVWCDTVFIDENGTPRISPELWMTKLNYSHQ